MEKLRRLALSLTLMSVLSASAVAGETNTPPCVPGETAAPPCAVQSMNDDSTEPGETSGSSTLPTIDVTDISEAVLWALLLF